MLREKLFLSIVFLVLSMVSGLACLPLFGLFVRNLALATQLGTGLLLVLPLISLGLLWRANPASSYDLRRYSFLSWACVLMTIAATKLVLVKEHADSLSMIMMLGCVCLAISFHARNKARKHQLKQSATAQVGG
jgi:hypothetical protein